MIDHFYKFFDQAEMLVTLQSLDMTYTDEQGNEQVALGSQQYAAWVVGMIDGLDGYHLNIRQIDISFDLSSLDGNAVLPQNPKCVWA